MGRSSGEKKKLADSPLLVVLTEIRFAPILTIGALVPSIQDRLRKVGFPGFSAGKVHQIQFNLNGGEPAFEEKPRWAFTSADGDVVVTLTSEAISIQTTQYEDFERFLELVRPAVEVVATAAEPSYAERIGLRYVDAVQNIGNRSSDFFTETVLSFSPGDLGVQSLLSSQHIFATTDVGHLQIRMSQVENAPLLPPDLNSPELASIGSAREGVHAILDIDSADEKRSEFSWDKVEGRLWAVHAYASTAFWKSITDQARTAWGETTVDG